MRHDTQRLAWAVAVSTALHLSFIHGIAVRTPARAPGPHSLTARLQSDPLDFVDAPASTVSATADRPVEAQRLPPDRPIDAPGAPPGTQRPRVAALPADVGDSRGSGTGDEPDAGLARQDAHQAAIAQDDEAIAGSTDRGPPAVMQGEASPPAEAPGEVSRARDDGSTLPAVDLPALADTTWYTAQDLDLYPRARGDVLPGYPEQAGGGAGEVTVLLHIDEVGRLVERAVVDADPPGVFEAAALAAFEGVAFEPGMREGRAVRSRVLVKIRFTAR